MSRRALALCFACSIGAHLAVERVLPTTPVRHEEPRRSLVSFVVQAPRAPEPPKPPEPVKTPAPTPLPRAPLAAQARVAPTATAVAEPAPPAPAEMSGVTLSSNDANGWSSLLGDGLAITAPIAVPRPEPAHAPPPAARPAPPKPPPPPPVVALGDLGQKPRPPKLDATLEQNYPAAARQSGLSGSARVVARVDADGAIRPARVVSESDAPPRDRAGRAVATEVRYTCHFRVKAF
jgi:hypothetical protein